jgi:hypothetical protein
MYFIDITNVSFLPHIRKYMANNYCPTVEDILRYEYHSSLVDSFRVRVRTTGIVEGFAKYKTKQIQLIDVGGPRNERKKWIHCFSNINIIFFCCDISE